MNKITIIQDKISNLHNDSLWYDGDIASFIKENGTELLLMACGDIRICDKKSEIVFDGRKIRGNGIKGGFKDDTDLRKIGDNRDLDEYYWENNNWFEILFKRKGDKSWDSIMGDVCYTYDGGINLLKDYINDDTWEDDNGDLA